MGGGVATAWVKIDDHFDEHPKLAKVGPVGWGVWLAGLAYCNRNLTDGFIPLPVAESIGGKWRIYEPQDDGRSKAWQINRSCGMHGEDMDVEWVIGLLLDAGLWDVTDDGYLIHDYRDYQPTRDEVEAERRQKQQAGAKGGQASAQARASATAQARAQAPAQAESKPVPVPVPVPPDLSLSSTAHPNEADKPPASGVLIPDLASEFMEAWNTIFRGVWKRDLMLTPDRRAKIETRLRIFTLDDLTDAARNLRESPHHCGANDARKVYATPEFLCRNDGMVDKWRNGAGPAAARASPPAPTGRGDAITVDERLRQIERARRGVPQ